MKNQVKNHPPLIRKELERLIFFGIVLVVFLLGNAISLFDENWPVHPSEAQALFFSHELLTDHDLVIERELNGLFPGSLFTTGFGVPDEDTILPRIAFGIIVVSAVGHLLGTNGVFIFVNLINLIGLVYLHAIVKRAFGSRVALVSLFFYAISVPYLLWSNYLYGNLLGFTFYLIGLFYLLRAVHASTPSLRDYLLAAVFFAGLLWTRYEGYVYLLLTLAYLGFRYRNSIQSRYAMAAIALLVLLLAPYAYLNDILYGSPFTIGYVVSKKQTSVASYADDSLVDSIFNLHSRFPALRIAFRQWGLIGGLAFLFDISKRFIFDIYVFPTVLGLLGGCMMLQRRETKDHLAVLAFLSLFFIYFEGASYHLGWDKQWIWGFYSRYWFPVYALLAICAGYFLIHSWLMDRNRPIISVLLAVHLLLVFHTLFFPYNGLINIQQNKHDSYILNQWASTTPSESVLISGYFGKTIIARPVLNPLLIDGMPDYNAMFHVILDEEDVRAQDTLVNYTSYLLERGYPVYSVEWTDHAGTYLDLKTMLRGKFQLQKVYIKDVYSDYEVHRICPMSTGCG